VIVVFFFFFSSRRRHTRWPRDWSSDVCSSDLQRTILEESQTQRRPRCEADAKTGSTRKDRQPHAAGGTLQLREGTHGIARLQDPYGCGLRGNPSFAASAPRKTR